MTYLEPAVYYVTSDPFFWTGMGVTSIIGLFIGSVIYDGVLREAWKAVVVLFSYTSILSIVNLARIMPQMQNGTVDKVQNPLASTVTIVAVTAFYLLGMWLGVAITNKAHKGRESKI